MTVTANPFLIGTHGPAVIVSTRVAAILYAKYDLSGLRVQARGADPELSAVLAAMHEARLTFRKRSSHGSGSGTEVAEAPEPAPPSEWLSTADAANSLGITDRAVRKAITRSALEATQVAGRYRISRYHLEAYRAQRG